MLTDSLSVSVAVLPIKTDVGCILIPEFERSKSTLVIAALQNSSSPQNGLTSIDFCCPIICGSESIAASFLNLVPSKSESGNPNCLKSSGNIESPASLVLAVNL